MLSDKTVFVIDDDEASALSLQALLSVNRFRVHALYANAEAFLDGYDHKMFGCLVLDVRLSGMSGLERQTERQTELQTELQRRKIDLLIVMISGHADDQSHRQAMDHGAVAFLQKPFSGAELRDAVRTALQRTGEA